MLRIDIPGRAGLELAHLVLDLNGTLAVDGRVFDGIPERLTAMRASLQPHVLTAGTHGHVEDAAAALGLRLQPVGHGDEKRDYVHALGPSAVVAIGNGANDVPMLAEAALAIGVLGREGLCAAVLGVADVVVTSPTDALDLLLRPARLIATLRA